MEHGMLIRQCDLQQIDQSQNGRSEADFMDQAQIEYMNNLKDKLFPNEVAWIIVKKSKMVYRTF